MVLRTRFRISTLLFATALIGVSLGWWQDRQRLQRERGALEQRFNRAELKALELEIRSEQKRLKSHRLDKLAQSPMNFNYGRLEDVGKNDRAIQESLMRIERLATGYETYLNLISEDDSKGDQTSP